MQRVKENILIKQLLLYGLSNYLEPKLLDILQNKSKWNKQILIHKEDGFFR